MTTFQIVAVCILGLGALVSVGFTFAFIIESCTKQKQKKSVTTASKSEKNNDYDEVNEIDLDAMIAKLEAASKQQESSNNIVEEIQEDSIEEKEETIEELVNEPEETISEIIEEEPIVEEPEEIFIAPLEEPTKETIDSIIQEEIIEEEPVVEEQEEVEEPVAPKKSFKVSLKDILAERKGPEFDYRVRLEKIKESQAKIDRDLEKTTRAILKYERTIRRKERNQKMLDRRALELTNLNLLMYSVTDIKNVDAEKKTRQEELTAHISELKASIQDAENYLEANKEKHENNVKLSDYLTHEKTRYADEVKELEALIASGKYFDDNGTNGNK